MIAQTRTYSSVVIEKPSTIQSELFKLIRHGKSNELNTYLSERRYARSLLTLISTNPSNNACLSLLMIAACHGHDLVVRELLTHSPDRTKMVELKGRLHSVSGDLVNNVTALWCALDRAHYSVARILIDEGEANINHGPHHPLLIDATIRGRLDIVHFFVENGYADINQTKSSDENQSTSLIVSASHGHTQIVDYLIKKNAELESRTCIDENTALAVAALEGHLESVRLLCMAGASSRVRNHAKKTPIVLAAENNKLEVVNFLLEQNHDNATFDDLELSIASHILSHNGTQHYRSEWVIELLRHSLIKRAQLKIPKSVTEPSVVYEFQQEYQSLTELDLIQNNDKCLNIQALLIQERIFLLLKDERLLTSPFEQAAALVQGGQFDLCLDLILHIFHLCQQCEFHMYFKQFFWLFYNMFNSKMPIPIDRFWKTCDLIFKPLDDCHVKDVSYLLAVAAKVRYNS